MVDVARVLGMTTRTLSRRDSDGAYILVATRSYPTSVGDLWDALTTAERIPRWFLPISGELRLGGRYQFKGNAGGEVIRCEPPRDLGVTWEMQGQVSWVNVTLSAESPESTRLRLEHIACVPDEMWKQFGPGAVGVGWESGLLGLDQYYSTGASVTPETGMQWMMSEEGKRFIRGSSDAWRDASIAFGTDPALARESAERTRAAYSGEQPDEAKG